MNQKILLRAPVELGFVATHGKFVGSLLPDDQGKLPRLENGELVVVDCVRQVIEVSKVEVQAVQVPIFHGTDPGEWDAVIEALKELGVKVYLVIMLGGVDPMDPADEEPTLAQMLTAVKAAKKHGVEHVAATSIEQWMQPGATRKDGAEFAAAVAQNVKLHARVYREAKLGDSCIKHWHVEFLRPGEFMTFTDLERLWTFIEQVNREIGTAFFRCMVDAAHCGDSEIDIPETRELIAKIAAGDGLGIVHASAKTTRGCLSTDDGWVAAVIGAAAKTGELRQVFVEMFNHQDDALEGLRQLEPGHGIDTTDGRDYAQVVADGLEYAARILNSHVTRGNLPAN